MDATREIRRCRRDAEERRYQAAELDSRAAALELRDKAYREGMKEHGYPIEDEPSAWRKLRTVVAQLKVAVADERRKAKAWFEL